MFLMKVSEDLTFQTYHAGVRCFVPFLSRNRLTIMDSWSKLEEGIHFLHCMPIENKKDVLREHFEVMATSRIIWMQNIRQKIYPSCILIFRYF